MVDNKYIDIINLPHHESKKHPRMSLEERSAQFAPFAALTGYEDEIEETGRLTTIKKEINEEAKLILDNKLQTIKKNILSKPKITCTYFIPDSNKEGGKYVEYTGNVVKIDEYNKIIIFEDKNKISISEIIKITLNPFMNKFVP